LAQKGKEQLYKEVVASYQEKRPKVYALECIENQFFIHVRIQSRDRSQFGRTLKRFADAGLNITFLSSSPAQESEGENIIFCLPDSPGIDHRAVIARESPDVRIERMDQAAVFAMNGPHFGDRYGIASELLTAFEEKAIHPTGLNCTVASITGSVPIAQMDETIRTIEACFEVPSVIRK
jgi:aspartokinase